MSAEKEIAKVGSAGMNLALWGATLFIGAAVVFAGWNWSQRRAAKKGNLV